jgi:hypothetical protein
MPTPECQLFGKNQGELPLTGSKTAPTMPLVGFPETLLFPAGPHTRKTSIACPTVRVEAGMSDVVVIEIEFTCPLIVVGTAPSVWPTIPL